MHEPAYNALMARAGMTENPYKSPEEPNGRASSNANLSRELALGLLMLALAALAIIVGSVIAGLWFSG